MSYSTMNQGGQQDSGYSSYGGGKSAGNQPMYKMAADQIQQSMGPGMAGQVGKLTTDAATGMMDKLYQGGPPKLDLSSMMPTTPEQRVAASQAGGGILKLRQPAQPFNPNPTPNPGFGGGKGMIQPIASGGFGGGKGMMRPMDVNTFYQNAQNKVPTDTYGQY